MDRSGSHILLNTVFSKTLRCFVVFFGGSGGISRAVVIVGRKCLIFRGFRLVQDVIFQGVIQRLLAGAGDGVVRFAGGIIGVRIAG